MPNRNISIYWKDKDGLTNYYGTTSKCNVYIADWDGTTDPTTISTGSFIYDAAEDLCSEVKYNNLTYYGESYSYNIFNQYKVIIIESYGNNYYKKGRVAINSSGIVSCHNCKCEYVADTDFDGTYYISPLPNNPPANLYCWTMLNSMLSFYTDTPNPTSSSSIYDEDGVNVTNQYYYGGDTNSYFAPSSDTITYNVTWGSPAMTYTCYLPVGGIYTQSNEIPVSKD